MKIAIVSNADDKIVEVKDVEDSFDPASVAHLFGRERASRICRVISQDPPSIDFATQTLVPNAPDVLDAEVRYTWRVESIGVPAEVENWKLQEELDSRGLSPSLEAVIQSLPEPQRSMARTRLGKKPTIRRHDPLTVALIRAMGIGDADADLIFLSASRRG